jgi:tetratricopeptide (TPR) repeat protein
MLNKVRFLQYLTILMLIVFCNRGLAQITHPKISPKSKLIQSVGLTEVVIEYSRPSARGRKVFGNVVPYGRMWRLGANESSHISFQDSVSILGNKLAPRTYALYAIPEKDEWIVIFHKNLNLWGDGRDLYDSAEDALRVVLPVSSYNQYVETFTMEMNQLTHDSGVLEIYWENTIVGIPFVWDIEQKMLDEIEEQIIQNPSAQTFYEAARYYQEANMLPQKALFYLNKAEEIDGAKYFISRIRSLVQASLKNFPEAISEAERSLAMAESLGKDEFVRMNAENIRKWKTLE